MLTRTVSVYDSDWLVCCGVQSGVEKQMAEKNWREFVTEHYFQEFIVFISITRLYSKILFKESC